jgi:hypothetical protein
MLQRLQSQSFISWAAQVMLHMLRSAIFSFHNQDRLTLIQGEKDYKALPPSTPRWKGNLPVGHFATWSQPNSGKFGRAEYLWLDWMLRGNETSSNFFLKGGAKAEGWDVVSAGMDKIPPVTPI